VRLSTSTHSASSLLNVFLCSEDADLKELASAEAADVARQQQRGSKKGTGSGSKKGGSKTGTGSKKGSESAGGAGAAGAGGKAGGGGDKGKKKGAGYDGDVDVTTQLVFAAKPAEPSEAFSLEYQL
jgi:hypothetical protein